MPQTKIRPRSRRRLAAFIAAPLLALIAVLSWGLSSPVGSSPDDDFHLVSIWCGQGENEGCTDGEDGGRVVYTDLFVDSVCYTTQSDRSARCQGADFGQNPDDRSETQNSNALGLYPPVYYAAMSLFATPNIEASVLVMKLVNSLLFIGLVSVLFWLLPIHRRPTLVWSLLITLVPLGLFLIPSTNPSGWAVISAGILWLALLGYMESNGWRRWALGGLAAVATLMGAGSRADAAVYSGFAVALVLFLTFAPTRTFWIRATAPLGMFFVSVLFFLGSNQKDALVTGLSPGVYGVENTSDIVLAFINAINVPLLWAGVFGTWPLGWFDTVLPGAVWVATLLGFLGALFIGLRVRIARKGAAVVAILIVMWAVPTVILVQSGAHVGEGYQPRYILPVIVMLAGFVLLQGRANRLDATGLQRGVIVVAVSAANALALFVNTHRYTTGANNWLPNLDDGVQWWWNLPVSPMANWVVGSLAFLGVALFINSRYVIGSRQAPRPAPETLALGR